MASSSQAGLLHTYPAPFMPFSQENSALAGRLQGLPVHPAFLNPLYSGLNRVAPLSTGLSDKQSKTFTIDAILGSKSQQSDSSKDSDNGGSSRSPRAYPSVFPAAAAAELAQLQRHRMHAASHPYLSPLAFGVRPPHPQMRGK